MKRKFLFIIIVLGFLNTSELLGQFKYKIDYTVRVAAVPLPDDQDGSVSEVFGSFSYGIGKFNTGNYYDDFILNSSTPISSYSSSSLLDGAATDPSQVGCDEGFTSRAFNGLTDTRLRTEWGCVPNIGGSFNVQLIQTLAALNTGPLQATICDPLRLRVGIANMSYQLEYNINNAGFLTFPGFEYPERITVRGITTRPKYAGTPSLDLSQIPGIDTASVIIFRVKYSDDNANISTPITFNIAPCEIELDGSANNPTELNPRCFQGSDGGFEVRFERELTANETLTIDINRDESGTGNGPYEPYATGTLDSNDLPVGVYEFRGLEAGYYQITWALGDVNGGVFAPSNPVSFVLEDPPELDYTLTNPVIGVTCNANGQINITPSGGSGNYNYRWTGTDQNGAAIPTSTSQNINTSIPGNYVLRLFDAAVTDNSCFVDFPAITIDPPPAGPSITLDFIEVPSSNNGGKGRISVTVNGTGTLTFDWQKDGTSFTPPDNQNLVDLDPGIYTLTVTDGGGCSTSLDPPITFDPLPPLAVTIGQGNFIYCEGETTTLTATGTGGTGGYTYSWTTGETSASINAGPGTYTVTVTDSSTDTATSTSFDVNYVDRNNTSTIITNALAVTVTNVTDVLCKGESTGRITLNITGGLPPYEVFWDGAFTAGPEDNTTLATGDHTYEVIDSNNCNISGGPIFIDEPANGLEVTGVKINDVSTNNGSDGIIELTITNGIGPFQFNWEKQVINGSYSPYTAIQTANPLQFTGFAAGTYLVTVVDGTPPNNCSATLQVPITIIEPGPLRINTPAATITAVNCFGESTGRIDASYEGTAPFEFVWFNDLGVELARGPDDFIENLPAGSYSFTVNDASNAGPLLSGNLILTQPAAPLEATFTQTEVTCFGGNDGAITVSATGGTAPLQYQISGGFALQLIDGVFTNLEAGTYTIDVSDANGCNLVPITVVLDPVDPISFDDANAVTPVSAPGGTDGSISVTVLGGSQPYFYRWTGPVTLSPINTANTTTIENLPEGVFTLEVSNKATFDIDTCYLTQQYTVTEQTAFSVGTPVETPTCFGQSIGTLSATVQATGSVIHNWRNTANDDLINTETTTERTVTTTGLGVGTYYLEIVDPNDITRTARSVDVEITALPEVSAVVSVVPTCIGSDTGAITFTNPMGSASDTYSYSIDGGQNFQPSPLFEDLGVGSYTLHVRPAESALCDFIVPGVTIVNSPAIFWDEPNTQITRASGAGANDGAIAPTFTGGTAPLSFLWSANANDATTQNVTGLTAGTYTVVVTDAANCSITESFEVTEVGPLTISNITPTDATCKDEANGSITTTATGEGTITFLWTLANGDPVPVSNGVNGANLTGILAGDYILTATDDNTTVVTPTITIDEPADAVGITNITPTDVSCFGGSDGSLNIQATGGSGGYTFSINGGPFQPSPINNLMANSYTVSVRDANGCVFTEPTPVLVLEPQALNLIINEQRPVTAANATNGAIFITAEGGSGNYTFAWEGPNGYTSTEEDISNLASGNYVVTITDANFTVNNDTGCRLISAVIAITEPGVLIANLTQTVLLECSGDAFAEITANVQGGILPYTYEWFQVNNGNNTALDEDTDIIANLSAGTYFLRATDANSVSIDANPITITAPTALEIAIDNTTNVTCVGVPTGTANITASGGTPPYQYFWSNAATVADVSGLDAGEYTVEVEDANGCITQSTIIITAPDDAIQIADATVNNVSAYQALDGSISLDVEGGSGPYTYQWTRLSDNSNSGNQATISNLAADSYTVLVTDANGCNITETYEVTQPDIIEESIVQPSCTGDSDGSISVLVNQGNGAFTYLWNTGATENTITNLAAGSYSVTVTGFADGPLTRTYILENPIPLEIDLGDDRVLCAGQVLALDASVDDATANYTWTSDNGFTSSESAVTINQTGNYTVTVQSQTGCTTQGTIFVSISSDEIDAQFAMSSQAFVGEVVVAVDISFPLPDGIEWIVPIGAEIITQDKDAVEFSFAEAGEYDITIVTTKGDCIAEKTKRILVVPKDGLIDEEDSKDGQRLVEAFIVYPNPTSGRFTADINLTERGDVSVKVFSFANNGLVASKKERGETSYSIPFDISGMPSGVYAVLLETPYGTSLRKVIIR